MIKDGIYDVEVLFYLLLVYRQQFRVERQAGWFGLRGNPGLAALDFGGGRRVHHRWHERVGGGPPLLRVFVVRAIFSIAL